MKICYREEAKEWLEALPVGNGRMGAMVYGGAEAETIELNEDTLWSGYPVQEYRGLSRETYLRAREHVKSYRNREAMHELEKDLLAAEDEEMYLPFGFLKLDFVGDRSITEYKRALDLEKGMLTVSYKNRENAYKHTAFASYPAECMVYQIRAEEAFGLRLSFGSRLQAETVYEKDKIVLSGQCPGRSGFIIGDSGKAQAFHKYSEADEEKGMRFEGRVKLQTDGGKVWAGERGITCENIRGITLVITMRTSFHGYQRHPFTEGKNEKAALDMDEKKIAERKSYDALLEEHVQDYQALFQRVKFSLGNDSLQELYPADQFAFYKEGTHSQAFYQVLFDYGRYLLISSSRPGTQAANLQGIWNQEVIPPWFCDYTININTQMNYWMAGPCNLLELLEPLVSLCRELTEAGKKTAEEIYQCCGSVGFHNADLWRKTTPANGRAMWSYWPLGLAWLCDTLYDQYLFGRDRAFLQEIFPMLHESVLFLRNLLEYTSEGYAILPGTSPENEYYLTENDSKTCDSETYTLGREKVSVSLYTENNNAIVRGLFRDYIEACGTLGIRNELKGEIEELLPQIIQTKIGKDGRILEWDKEYEEADIHHRHLSHLYAFHPGREWTRRTPEYFEAVKRSLDHRGDEGTGWSLAWKISMWARLEDGEHVGRIMKNLFHLVKPREVSPHTRGGLYPNLFCAHPPFQIDGNLGFTAGVAEMLVQSHDEEIVLLPGILPEWKDGEITGLIVRGGAGISLSWKEGKLIYIEIKGEPEAEFRLRYGSRKWTVQLNRAGIYKKNLYRRTLRKRKADEKSINGGNYES